MAIQHDSYWLERTSRSRRPSYSPLRGAVEADVVIVGGGLIGCACALAFTTARVQVVLVERDAIGQAGTARGSGVLREVPDASFANAAARHGRAAARTLWQTFRRGSLELAATLRRLETRCDVETLLTVARPDAEAVRRLRREYVARRAAGFRDPWITPAAVAREAATESGGAIRTPAVVVDPYRACVALAAGASARGASIHDGSPALRVRTAGQGVEVTTAAGSVQARAVIIATSDPLPDLKALRRHLKPRRRYAVVTQPMTPAMRRAVGTRASSLQTTDSPPHLLRWLPGDRIFFSGADREEIPERAREKALTQRTGQLMYELSLLYPEISGLAPGWSWDAPRYETADGLPFAGLHRNFPRHLFGMGGGTHGAGFAGVAARTLLRIFQGRAEKGDDLFGFARVL